MSDIQIRSAHIDETGWSASACRMTPDIEPGCYPPYAIAYGERRKFTHGSFTDVPIYWLHGPREMPSITIDRDMVNDDAFRAPYTVEKAKRAYFIALTKSPRMADAIEQAIDGAFKSGLLEGKQSAKQQMREALGLD